MMNFIRSKYLPYALGIICAAMFYLVYICTQVDQGGMSLFSEAMMGDIAIFLILLDLVPLFMERIIYTHEHNNDTKDLTVMHVIKVGIMCLACICAVLSLVYMFKYDIDGKVNLLFLFGRAGLIITTASFAMLMVSGKLKSASFVQVSATASVAGAALVAVFHLVKLAADISVLAEIAGQVPGSGLFIMGLVHFIWYCCLFLADGAIIYLSVTALKRNGKELPLEYL